MKRYLIPTIAALASIGSVVARAGTITSYSDSGSFDTAIGVPVSVEDFSPGDAFPITTGVLNSSTNLHTSVGGPIVPGEILPGVTYSTPIGSGDFFNIDAGGGYVGGFLDRVFSNGPGDGLTVTFDDASGGFGFDTNDLMAAFSVTINFNDGPSVTDNEDGAGFYGFVSSAADITSAYIQGTNGTFTFDIDNFTYPTSGGGGGGPSVPDAANTLVLLGAALLGIAGFRRRLARAC
jgi:hypothetical protein